MKFDIESAQRVLLTANSALSPLTATVREGHLDGDPKKEKTFTPEIESKQSHYRLPAAKSREEADAIVAQFNDIFALSREQIYADARAALLSLLNGEAK